MIFPDTYYPYPMGLPNFCYHLAIKEMAINDKIRLVSLVVYNYILPRKTGKCNNLPRCGVSSDLTEHMAHLVQAAVWTAGLDDRLADSGLIPFQFRQAYRTDLAFYTNGQSVCLTELKGYQATVGEPVIQPRRPNSRLDKVRHMFQKVM